LSVLGETEVSNSAREQISRLLQEVHEAITDLKTTMLPALEHTIGNISLVVAYSEGLEQVRSAVVTLASSCEDHLRSATTGELSQLCSILVQQREEYIPVLSSQYIQELVGIRSLLSTQYLPPVQLLSGSSIQVDGVEDYATRLDQAALSHLYSVYGAHTETVHSLLQHLVGNMSLAYDKVSLHRPQSEELVEEYFGPRYLTGWEELRSGLFVILVVCTLVCVLCVLACSVRGLVCVFDMYRSGYDRGTALAATHSADVIRRAVYILFCTYFLVGVSVFVTLPLATTISQTCGESSDFEELTDHFIDSPDVWNGGYPLGSLLLGNSSATITLSSMKDICERGGSLFEAYQLRGFYSFTHVNSLLKELVQMIKGFSSFTAPLPSVLGYNVTRGLTSILNLPRRWEEKLESVKEMRGVLMGNHSQDMMKTFLLVQNFSRTVGDSRGSIGSHIHTALTTTTEAWNQLSNISTSSRLLDREITHSIQAEVAKWNEYSAFQDTRLRIARDLQSTYSHVYHQQVLATLSSALQSEENAYFSFLNTSAVCSTGQCLPAARLFRDFTEGVCVGILDGLDLIWSSQCAVLVLLIPFLALVLITSRRLTYERYTPTDHKTHLTDLVFHQSLSILWYLLSASAAIWLIVSIMNSSDFHSQFCPDQSTSGCCPHCTWIFALLFVSISLIIAVPCFCYLCYLLHRIRECKFVRTSKYWTSRYHAVSFYLKLFVLAVQDLPIVVISCVYLGGVGRAQLTAGVVIAMVTINVVIFITKIVLERKELPHYWKWLRKEVELKSDWARKCTTTPTPPPQFSPPDTGHTHPTGQYEMSFRRNGAPPSSGAATPVPPYEHSPNLCLSYNDPSNLHPPYGSPPNLHPPYGSPPIPRPSYVDLPTPHPPHEGQSNLHQSNEAPSNLHSSYQNSSHSRLSTDSPPSIHLSARPPAGSGTCPPAGSSTHPLAGSGTHPPAGSGTHPPVSSSTSDVNSDDQSHPRHRPDSVLVLDQVLESDHEAMMKRKWAGSEARRQGGVDVAALPPAHYGSSTVHSGSMFSVHWGSDSHSTYTPSLAHTHYTSGEEGTDHWDGSRKHYMRKKMSFSGELTMDV
jgi:hypothetical protein